MINPMVKKHSVSFYRKREEPSAKGERFFVSPQRQQGWFMSGGRKSAEILREERTIAKPRLVGQVSNLPEEILAS